jgi:hypothetical protein
VEAHTPSLYNMYCSVCTRTRGLAPNRRRGMVQIGAADRPRTSTLKENSTSSRGSKPIGSADTDLESDVAVGSTFYGPRCIDTCPVFHVNFRLQTIDIGGLCYTWLVIPSYFERLFEEVSVIFLRRGFLDCE